MSAECSRGSIRGLPELIERLSPSRVMVVRGSSSFEGSGAAPHVVPAIGQIPVDYVVARPNPDVADVQKWSEQYRATPPDVIVAVGGGSTIDTAKLIRRFGPSDARQPPLVAIPTTSGSGAEATHFAVMYDGGVKQSVADASMRPDHVILDPALTDTLPAAITAATGFDALSQAIESAWSVKSTDETRSIAFRAIELAATHLVPATVDPASEHRDAMMLAAHLAGTAIDTTFTTAPHALSYKLTSAFGVPHGHAVALTLGPVLEYNAGVGDDDCIDPRGPDHVKEVIDDICGILGVDSPASANRHIRRLLDQVQLASRLGDIGASSEESLWMIARSVNVERLANNPRQLDTTSIMGILRTVDRT